MGGGLWWLERKVSVWWWWCVGGEGDEGTKAGEGAHGDAVEVYVKRREFR